MRRLLLVLSAFCLLGCPGRGTGDAGKTGDTTAAPARAMTSALFPPRTQSLQPALAKPKLKPQTLLPGQGIPAPDDHPQRAALGLTEELSAVLESPTDRDEFALWLPVGYPLEAEVHSYGEVSLELLDPQGRPLARGLRSLSHHVQVTGIYTLRASSIAGQGLHYTIVTR